MGMQEAERETIDCFWGFMWYKMVCILTWAAVKGGIEGQLVHMKKVQSDSFTLMAKRTHSCPSFPLRSCAGLSLFWLVKVNQCMCKFSVLACSFPFEGSTRWGISVHRSRTPKQITWVQIIVAQSWQKYRLIEFQALFRALFLMTGL